MSYTFACHACTYSRMTGNGYRCNEHPTGCVDPRKAETAVWAAALAQTAAARDPWAEVA